MQPQRRAAVAAFEVPGQEVAPLRVLREAEGLLTGVDDLVEQLLDPVELARPPGER